MPDLCDGEIAEVWGSGAKPYQLKHVAGVYSCSCPAWRNQSLPIDQRTCKHLRNYRGDAAETARLGTNGADASACSQPPRAKLLVVAPPLLLAETWSAAIDPAGWWLSEKLDGVRAYWDGQQFLSRNGNRIFAPEWFTRGLPPTPLDGELWGGRKQFQRTVSIIRSQNGAEQWEALRYLIFDAPTVMEPFEQRCQFIHDLWQRHSPRFAQPLPQRVCRDRAELAAELQRVESLGGEGLMLRRPGSLYVPRRSDTLLKVKSFRDCEARVIGHQPGKGRHQGRLGALLVELANGIRCAVGTGLTDTQRNQPPAIGTTIILQYQELTDGGVPRFPVFAGIRTDGSLTFS